MKLIRGLHNLSTSLKGSVATIGNFDGLHIGHQQIIQQLKQASERLELPSVVILFEPQPAEFFSPGNSPLRLSRLRDKIAAFDDLNIDYLLCLRFDDTFAGVEAETFVIKTLLGKLHIKHLIVGDDFRFGKNRQGDYQFLKESGDHFGFQVETSHTIELYGERVSSTRIRRCLALNDFDMAKQLLGRPFSLRGKVAHGKKLGAEIGYPTINIRVGKRPVAVQGIFAVHVDGIEEQPMNGVASLGRRPTVDGKDLILEVYLLNFSGDIYGRCVNVTFLKKFRDEEKFKSIEILKRKIEQDVTKATQFFNL